MAGFDPLVDIERRLASGHYPGPTPPDRTPNVAGDVRWLVSEVKRTRGELAERDRQADLCGCCQQRSSEREDRHGQLWCAPCHDACDPDDSCQVPQSI